jgi:hypothetical protein
MKNPNIYATTPFHGMHVMVVDGGTVVRDERSGEEVTVDDKTVAAKGPVLYCTQPVFDAMKARVEAEPTND